MMFSRSTPLAAAGSALLLASRLALGAPGTPATPRPAPATRAAAAAEDAAPETRVETMAWRELRLVADRERQIWERLRNEPDDENRRLRAEAEFRDILTAYENLIRSAPNFAEAYAAYGLLLSRTGNRDEAVKAFLRANGLNPNIPMVKNQLGNYLTEEGNYREALGYYLMATELDENEPLYHYQLGSLLHAYRDFFVDDGVFDRATLDGKMQAAFRRAAELAPDRWAYIYRYAETFYDLETPRWKDALAEWKRLEEKAPEGLGKQTIRLHEANVLIELGRADDARALLETVTEEPLAGQKATVVARLSESADG